MKLICKFLLVALMLAVFLRVSAEEDSGFAAEQEAAMRAAGRNVENVLAHRNVRYGNDWAAVFLAQEGKTAQLTVLEREEAGNWEVVCYNDTIPMSMISGAELIEWTRPAESDREEDTDLILSMTKSAAQASDDSRLQYYRAIRFRKTPQGIWEICGAENAAFVNCIDSRCPYWLLSLEQGNWVYRFYEMIMEGNGITSTRSAVISEFIVSPVDMAAYTELLRFDYSQFFAYMDTLIPAQYEHARLPASGYSRFPEKGTEPSNEHTTYVYYNPYGGQRYHADCECPSVTEKYRPLTPILYDELNTPKYAVLTPCRICKAPERPDYNNEDGTE